MKFLDDVLAHFSQPTAMDYYVFCVQISSFLKAGLSLNQALEQITPHQKNSQMQKMLKAITADMDVGMSAAAAFAKQTAFPDIFAPTIESGEKASELETLFNHLPCEKVGVVTQNRILKIGGVIEAGIDDLRSAFKKTLYGI